MSAIQTAVLFALALAISGPARASDGTSETGEQPRISWLHTATRSGRVDPGTAPETSEDAILRWLIERLPGYRHTILLADAARMTAILQSRDSVCYPTIVKTTERQSFVIFSQRLLWGLPARVIVLDEQADQFTAAADTHGALELSKLLADPALTGAFENARNLAPAVAAQLSRHSDDGRLVKAASGANMYAMLAAGRVDWVIGFPDETRQVFRAEYPDRHFRSYAIAGGAAPLPGYVGCSKEPESERIIADIDRMLRGQHVKDPAQEAYDAWLDPTDRAALHRAIAETERGAGE